MGGPPDWGFISAAFGIGTLSGGFVAHAPQRRAADARCDDVRVRLCGAGVAARVHDDGCGSIALGTFAHGVCGQIVGVLWYTTLHRKIPAEMLSRVSAYDALGSFALAPLGLIAAGVSIEALGTQTTAWIAVAMVVIPTALTLCVRDVRQMRLDA